MMKRGWEIYRIGDFCDVKTGKLDANASSADGTYPFFTCSKEPLRIETYSYDAECVLVAGNGDLNVKYYKGKFDAYQRTYIITLKEHIKNISVKYLYKFFLLYVETLRSKSIGGVIKYIKLGDITNAKIMIPPIVEQERIVGELDCLSGIIANKRAQLRELDSLAQSIFYTMFGDPITNDKGWQTKKLGDVCQLMVDGDWIESKDQSDNGIRLLQTGNVGIGCFKDKSEHYKFISEETFDRLNCTEIFEGDILISRLPEPIGRACIVPALNFRMITAVDCSIIRLKDIVLPEYVVYYTRSNKYNSDIEQYVTGAVRKRISRSNLSKINIPIPPIDLQKQFAEKIENIERQKELITKSIKETEDLFNSRMSYYFD